MPPRAGGGNKSGGGKRKPTTYPEIHGGRKLPPWGLMDAPQRRQPKGGGGEKVQTLSLPRPTTYLRLQNRVIRGGYPLRVGAVPWGGWVNGMYPQISNMYPEMYPHVPPDAARLSRKLSHHENEFS